MNVVRRLKVASFLMIAVAATAPLSSQSTLAERPQTRITAKVDEKVRATLKGNVPLRAKAQYDNGAVDDSTPMQRMILTLSHSDAQEAGIQSLLSQQQDKGSPMFHQWLTPQQFGAQFGASDADIASITAWLTAQGFTIGKIGNGKNSIEFSGNAGQVRKAFQTEIHKFVIDGVTYQSNVSDPSIPAALSTVVRGVVSLHNFPRKPHHAAAGLYRRDMATGALTQLSGVAPLAINTPVSGGAAVPSPDKPKPNFTYVSGSSTEHALSPYDFATIYNVLPLWKAGIDGTGQKIAILQETNIHIDDVRAFRSFFGLPANDPVVVLNGPDPGVTAYDEGEADIDVQWAGAVAKGATILLVASASTATTAGTDLSALYAIDNNIAPITSLSYGECELGLGTGGNAFYNSLWQQGATQGISHFISTGDSGAAVCDDGSTAAAAYGLTVSGMASTPYNTAVGGTDFLGSLFNSSSYWSATNAPTTNSSALQYIPETTWNDSCTNPLFQSGFETTPYASAEAACKALSSSYREADGGSGGQSNCTINSTGTVAGCSGGYPKPSYQTGVGVPADSLRDIPDVSLMASNGFLGSFYVICQEDADTDGKSCNFNSPYADFEGYGGTSVSTPAFAGIMALVDQKTNARQGNANYVLYDLFNQQTTAGTACTSTMTNFTTSATATAVTPAAGCVFNDITSGTNSMACTKNDPDCYLASSYTYGILSTTVVSGITVTNGGSGYTSAPTVTVTGGTGVVATATLGTGATAGQVVSVTVTNGGSGFTEGAPTVTFTSSSGSGATATASLLVPPTTLNESWNNTTGYDLATGLGSVNANNLVNSWANITFVPTTTTLTAPTTTLAHGSAFPATIGVAASSGAAGSPTGNVNVLAGTSPTSLIINNSTTTSSGNTPNFLTLTPNGSGTGSTASGSYTTLPGGTYNVTAVYGGDGTYASSTSTPVSVTVTPENATLTSTFYQQNTSTGADTATSSLIYGGEGFLNFQVLGASGNGVPTGSVTIYQGGTPFTTVNLNSSGTGGFEDTSLLPVGSYTFTATYSGDSSFNAIPTPSGSISFAVTQAPTKITLTRGTTSIAAGASETLTGAVVGNTTTSGYGNLGAAPTGTVQFWEGATSGTKTLLLGTAPFSTFATSASTGATTATAKLTTANLPFGSASQSDYITLVYSGDTNYATVTSASSAVTVAAGTKTGTTTTVSASGTPLSYGSATTLSSTVASNSTTVSPAGTDTVTFYVDGVAQGSSVALSGFTATTSGTANSASLTTLSGGTHYVSALYSGDTNFLGSSGSYSLVINPVGTAITLTGGAASATQGTTLTYTATIPFTTTANPTGTMTFTVDGASTGVTINVYPFAAGGVGAYFNSSTLLPGMHTIQATYSGDKNYGSSTASSSVTINAAPLLSLTVNQRSSIILGAPVAVNVQASALAGGPIPTGSVTYTVDGGTASTPLTLTNGITSFTVTGLSEMKHTIVVTYSGDSTYSSVSQILALNGDLAQTILFPALSNITFANINSVALSARSTSGLPVTYTVSGPATVSGGILTVTGTGTITVTASQPGNTTSFAGATSVTRSFVAQ